MNPFLNFEAETNYYYLHVYFRAYGPDGHVTAYANPNFADSLDFQDEQYSYRTLKIHRSDLPVMQVSKHHPTLDFDTNHWRGYQGPWGYATMKDIYKEKYETVNPYGPLDPNDSYVDPVTKMDRWGNHFPTNEFYIVPDMTSPLWEKYINEAYLQHPKWKDFVSPRRTKPNAQLDFDAISYGTLAITPTAENPDGVLLESDPDLQNGHNRHIHLAEGNHFIFPAKEWEYENNEFIRAHPRHWILEQLVVK